MGAVGKVRTKRSSSKKGSAARARSTAERADGGGGFFLLLLLLLLLLLAVVVVAGTGAEGAGLPPPPSPSPSSFSPVRRARRREAYPSLRARRLGTRALCRGWGEWASGWLGLEREGGPTRCVNYEMMK